jgi:hypothetical protein
MSWGEQRNFFKKGQNIKVFMKGGKAALRSTQNELLFPFKRSVWNVVTASNQP